MGKRIPVATHEVIDVDMSEDFFTKDQYFIVYSKSERETFNPANIIGVWGADTVSSIMARFRQTGILVVPHGTHPEMGETVVQDAISVFILRPEAVLYKLPRFKMMTEEEHQEYLKNEELVRSNIERFKTLHETREP